ncbi:MAG: SufD family Fe-S cluster assembly protein [Acidilobaceae archaeon]
MALKSWIEWVRERAKQALDKPSPYGVDVNIRDYPIGLESIEELDLSRTSIVGIDIEKASREALYLQVDHAIFKYLSRIPGLEISRIEEFIDSNPDIARDYVWRLIDPGTDKYTAVAALRGSGGYFIRVKRKSKIDIPVQACLLLRSSSLQAPHNIVIVEEGAEVTVYTGCLIMPESAGLHIGITEFYVERGGKLRFIMVHAWNNVTHIRPRTAALIDEGGEYVSYYMNLSHVKTLQTYPRVKLMDNARAYMASIILGLGEANIDIGSLIELNGYSSGEIVSRVLARDTSTIYTRALIRGSTGKGHIECSGLMLDERSKIVMLPQLEAKGINAQLTHEASIGKLSEDEINYLVSKGFTREEAEGILIRGFMNVDLTILPEKVRKYVAQILDLMSKKAL